MARSVSTLPRTTSANVPMTTRVKLLSPEGPLSNHIMPRWEISVSETDPVSVSLCKPPLKPRVSWSASCMPLFSCWVKLDYRPVDSPITFRGKDEEKELLFCYMRLFQPMVSYLTVTSLDTKLTYTQSPKYFLHSQIHLNVCQFLNSSVCVLRGNDLWDSLTWMFKCVCVCVCVCVCACVFKEGQTPQLDKPIMFLSTFRAYVH